MKKLVFVFLLFLIGCRQIDVKAVPTVTPTSFTSPTKTSVPTLTPTSIPTSVPPSTPSLTPAVVTYVVQPGDTLWEIAYRFGVTVESLALTNNISDPNLIYPGQVLIIKGDKAGVEPTAPIPDLLKGKEIIVVIHTQRTYAFEDGILHKTFIVSTGVAEHPTVIGKFRIQVKLDFDDMTDNKTYYLPNVPWVMYFGNDDVSWHEGYSLHGTYWHHNFGVPMSHGCVNLSIPDAEWLYNWSGPLPTGGETDSTKANPGTIVLIIP
ncbi:MAG: hypothetical protein UU16_C0006G0020 [Candidatus Woesebacteria bacterium GW2011_GWA2_40_7]|uniref:Uncharacterized protein n=1 Tax=Candidatus Woesebacteria bacterium GW2011_GWA2_40_7 TaxID=1618562 RepID=A0A0G0TGU5_9BACT|nr:MAG: hypothetical protein UU16_C0006G0020 [Candidatus Woesebacteria bacterium GW2011_GWA2_40_7]